MDEKGMRTEMGEKGMETVPEKNADELGPKSMSGKKRLTLIFSIGVIVILAGPFLLPRSFESIMPGFDPKQVTDCYIHYCYSEVMDEKLKYYDQTRIIDPASGEFQELIVLLRDRLYRKQAANFFFGGSSSAHSITLDPYAEISFHQGTAVYEFQLLGEDIVAGNRSGTGKRYDYSHWGFGGKDFQREVVAFAGAHGTLIEETEL